MGEKRAVYKGLHDFEITAIDEALKRHQVEYNREAYWLIKGETWNSAPAPVPSREFSFNLIGAGWRTEHGSATIDGVIQFINNYYKNRTEGKNP